MNASYEWLKAFVPFDASPEQLRDMITAHTATVDELVPVRQDLAPIVVARVVEASRHPDSDHLWLTKVDDGGGELLEVVCGAPNVSAGKLYPFARVGVTIPTGMKMERRKIRGVVSNGMLCSAKELNLGIDGDGILELDVDVAPGTKLLSAMPVGDTRLVVDVGANRSDLHSHLGLARELSAVLGTPWRLPDIAGLPPAIAAPQQTKAHGSTAGVDIRLDPDAKARRYAACVIRGVKVGPSPGWLATRVESVGGRSINNVVDATNYVLHELGQPVHAFDLARLRGGIVVRRAKPGETIVTLDRLGRLLKPQHIVIADDQGAQAIAGVIGGLDSEVTDATTDVFIEVASFDPGATRNSRKLLGLATDASYRFERGVDPEGVALALDRVARIVMAVAGGTVDGAPVEVTGAAVPRPEITLRVTRVAKLLGEALSADACERLLRSAGFEITEVTDVIVRARTPSWRADVATEVDLIEELARFHGYDNFIAEIRPFRPTTTHDDPMWAAARRVRDAMVGLGYLEARPMPFVTGGDGTHVRVANPLSEDEAYLRTSVVESLARCAEYNLARRTGDIRLFEIGAVFHPSGQAMPHEHTHVGVVLMGRRRPVHFSDSQPPIIDEWDAKAAAEAALRAAYPGGQVALTPASGDRLWEIRAQGAVLGWVARLQLDAPVWAAPAFSIEFSLGRVPTAPAAPRGTHNYMEGSASQPAHAARYRPLPTMPPAEIDLALVVPNAVAAARVEEVIKAAGGETLEAVELFDQYVGPGIADGHRSLAWRLTFRHPERTLRDREVEGRRTQILRTLEEELHVRQRTT